MMAGPGSQILKIPLSKSRQKISLALTQTNCGIEWLNNFCGDFYVFANSFQKFIACDVWEELEDNENLDTIFLCLAQVCLCTKYLESIIRAEETAQKTIPASRKHFVDRILWCLDKLESAIDNLAVSAEEKSSEQAMASFGFMLLLEITMDHVGAFSTYQEDPENDLKYALDCSNEIHCAVRLMISHALALANVALLEDKTALSALCQKVLRDSAAFQQECSTNFHLAETNEWNRRLKAIVLGDSLTQLHHYVDETILRLIFMCYTDLEKFSLDKLRAKMRQCNSDDAELDEFIADFDVNLDRLAQIGLFAANESNSPKLKTIVRSSLASLEALDPCIIPSLQAGHSAAIHSEILEQHFYEEITKLKTVLYEIVNAQPISKCFYEMLNNCVAQTEKHYNKTKLDDILQMGEFLLQYFQYSTNKRDLNQTNSKRMEHFQKFTLMLHECRAILMCADQVDHSRILKRFKILRAVTRKFVDALKGTSDEVRHKNESMSNLHSLPAAETNIIDLNESQFALATIEPSVCSILYRNENEIFSPRRRAVSESMRGNYSMCPQTPLKANNGLEKNNLPKKMDGIDWQQPHLRRRSVGSVRRKESLRTVMFRRQNSVVTQKAREFYLQNSASLQISEILDQLTNISLTESKSANVELLNTTRIE